MTPGQRRTVSVTYLTMTLCPSQILLVLPIFIQFTQTISIQNEVVRFTTNLALSALSHCQLRVAFPKELSLTSSSMEVIYELSSHRQAVLIAFNTSSPDNLTRSASLVMRHTPNCGLNILLAHSHQPEDMQTVVQAATFFRDVGNRRRDYYVALTSRKFLRAIIEKSLLLFRVRYKLIVCPSENKEAQIFSYCAYCPGTFQENLQEWDSNDDYRKMFEDMTLNFRGIRAPIAVFNNPSHLEIATDGDNVRVVRGMHADLLRLVQEILNFSYVVGVKSPTHPHPSFFEDLLVAGKVNMAMIVTPTATRLRVADLTTPISYIWLTFLTPVGTAVNKWDALFKGFKLRMWLLILLSIFIAIATLLVLIRYKKQENIWTTGSVLAFVLKSFVHQDNPQPSHDNGIRVFLTFWSIYCMIICTAYESKLMTSLMFPAQQDIPQDFEELAERTDFKIVFNTLYGAAHRMLNESTNPVYSAIFHRARLEPNSTACAESVTLDAKTACVIYQSIAEFVGYTIPQLKFTISPAKTYFVAMSWMTRKHSLLTDNLNRIIAAVKSTGLTQKWVRMDYAAVRKRNFLEARNGNRTWGALHHRDMVTCREDGVCALKWTHLEVVFVLLAVGIVLAGLAWVAERFSAFLDL